MAALAYRRWRIEPFPRTANKPLSQVISGFSRPEDEFLPDKSLKSFSPCYSQSPLQLCLAIPISSNSRNLLKFLQFSYCTL
jgi:hypothetical protein